MAKRVNTEDFTSNIVAVVISVIVVAAVGIPIVNELTKDMEAGTTKTILEILPVFLVLAVLMIVIKIFMDKKN